MDKIKDFLYKKNDILIAFLILAVAAAIITFRIGAIMEYPETLVQEQMETVEETTIDKQQPAEKTSDKENVKEEKADREKVSDKKAKDKKETKDKSDKDNSKDRKDKPAKGKSDDK